MLQSRHRRTRSTHPGNASSESGPPAQLHKGPSITETGVVEWSKTGSRAVTRLVPSLHQIFSRGSNFCGTAGDLYGLLLSADSAFIFPYTTTSSTPPILTFPLPQGEDKLLGALVPGPSNEPGLFVVMPTTGRVGFWPALHSALAPSSGIESKLSLSSGESVTNLCNAGAAGLVLSTSSGRLVHVSLRDAAGKAVVVLTNMSGSGGWLGAIINIAARREIVAVKAGAAHSREERQIHVVSKRGSLSIWEIARGGNYRNILDCDLSPLFQDVSVSEIIDAVAYPVEANSVLALAKTTSGGTTLLEIRFDNQAQPSIAQTISLPSLNDPQIQLPNPGHVAFIHTRDSVHLVTIADARVELVKFKEEVEIVAIGIEDQLKNKRNPGLVLLTKGAGVIRIELFSSSSANSEPNKSLLEQAVFYGSMDGNPIAFTAPATGADDQMQELSLEILKGSSPFLHKSVNLAETLKYRTRALETLTSFVCESATALTLLVLRENIEKMFAGETLWNSVDSRLERNSIIPQLIPRGSHSKPQSVGIDEVRNFFLRGLDRLPELVLSAHRASIEAAAVLESEPLSRVILETNEIVLSILISATTYRDKHTEYGSSGSKWSSTKDILQCCTVQFDITRRLIAGLQTGEGDDLRDQAVGLAQLTCRLYEDSLAVMEKDSAEYNATLKQYNSLRPQWLKNLVYSGRTDRALEIGEKFKDYQSLVEICHDQGEKANDEETINTLVRRLEWYLQLFGYEFAAVLWEYYITHRQFWNLLHEFPNHRAFLTRFFSDGRYPNISWMNDVIIDNFAGAGEALLQIPEQRIEKRKIQLSIAKLALLVDNESVPESVERQARSCGILDALASQVHALTKDAIDETAAIELACASLSSSTKRNQDRPNLLRRHVAKLVRGEILHLGEAIDFLTTKREPDFFSALQLLKYNTVPDAVQTFNERLIWRRCFISDDWLKINDTKGLSDQSIEEAAGQTNLFKTVRDCLEHSTEMQVTFRLPHEVQFVDAQVVPMPELSEKVLQSLRKEYELENELLGKYLKDADLATWHAGIISGAEDSLAAEAGDDFVHVEADENGDVSMEG